MSLEKAEKFLEDKGYGDRIILMDAPTSTVAMAAEALGVEPGMIAKTMAFIQDDKIVLILTEGIARVDNRNIETDSTSRRRWCHLIAWRSLSDMHRAECVHLE